MKLHTKREHGFTLVEIIIVVFTIGLLAAIALPNLVRARATAQTNTCVRNLRTLDNAKQQWALETGKLASDTPNNADIQPYVGRGTAGTLVNVHCPLVLPGAPMGGYDMQPVGSPPLCLQQDPNKHPAKL